jgi:hypothetical protein
MLKSATRSFRRPLLALPIIAGLVTVGAMAIPMYAEAATTTVSSTLGSVISLFTTSGTVTINATPTAGGVQTIANDVVTVSTNDSAGYTLKLGETTGTTTLTGTSNSSNTIPASTATQTTPLAESVNTWGYRVDSIGGFGAGPTSSASNTSIGAIKFAGVAASGSPNTIKATATTATNDTTNVWYGVAVNTSTPADTYTNSVTYTAVAN